MNTTEIQQRNNALASQLQSFNERYDHGVITGRELLDLSCRAMAESYAVLIVEKVATTPHFQTKHREQGVQHG